MSNVGMMDAIRGLFTSGDGGGREAERPEEDPVEARVERVDQVASGVRMAAASLSDDRKGLRRQAEEAADAALDAARRGKDSVADAGPDGEGDGADPGTRRTIQELSGCIDALEELHYRLLRIEVHPEARAEDDREAAAGRARESVERVRETVESLRETAGA